MKRQGKTLDGTLFTHNKEGNAVICDNMEDLGDIMLGKRSQAQKRE
jgi:hypothetical protein